MSEINHAMMRWCFRAGFHYCTMRRYSERQAGYSSCASLLLFTVGLYKTSFSICKNLVRRCCICRFLPSLLSLLFALTAPYLGAKHGTHDDRKDFRLAETHHPLYTNIGISKVNLRC